MPKFVWLAVAALAVICTGCDDRPYRVPVSGQVLIDGQPLEYGFIQIIPENARPAYAELDSEGRFTLTSWDEGDGVVPGEHIVRVSSNKPLSATTQRWYAPHQYNEIPTNDEERAQAAKVKIDESMSDLIIELTWDRDPAHKGPWVETIASGEE
jgi:hypothetical protein